MGFPVFPLDEIEVEQFCRIPQKGCCVLRASYQEVQMLCLITGDADFDYLLKACASFSTQVTIFPFAIIKYIMGRCLKYRADTLVLFYF